MPCDFRQVITVLCCFSYPDLEQPWPLPNASRSPLSEIQGANWRDALNCGVSAPWLLLNLGGQAVKFDAVSRPVPVTTLGSNMADMQRACETLGLHSQVLKVKPSELERITWPAIAHVNLLYNNNKEAGHYFVVVGLDRSHVYLIDPSGLSDVVSMARGDFCRTWRGFLLVPVHGQSSEWQDFLGIGLFIGLALWIVSTVFAEARSFAKTRRVHKVIAGIAVSVLTLGCDTNAVSPPNSGGNDKSVSEDLPHSALTTWDTERDLGIIMPGNTKSAEFIIENTGTLPTKLEIGTVSCSCGGVIIEKTNLPAGQQSKITMSLRRTGKVGPIAATARVDAGPEWCTVTVRGLALGASLPADEVVCTDRRTHNPVSATGVVYVTGPTVPVSVSAGILPRQQGLVVLGKTDVEKPEPVRQAYARNIVQLHNGAWHFDWAESTISSDRLKEITDPLQLVGPTGHHLEWTVLVPPELRTNDASLAKAASFVLMALEKQNVDAYIGNYCPFSHCARALLVASRSMAVNATSTSGVPH